MSLALFEDRDTGLPLYHQCYEGNRNDVTHFPFAREAARAERLLPGVGYSRNRGIG